MLGILLDYDIILGVMGLGVNSQVLLHVRCILDAAFAVGLSGRPAAS